MLNKQISIKEMILIGILIILLAYYFVVQGPVAKQTQELETELSEATAALEVAQPKLVQMKQMQDEIDAIFEKYDGKPPRTPDYNNMNTIITEMNLILESTVRYNISFGDEVRNEEYPNIVRRPINVTFTTKTYKGAVNRIREISESPNRYLINNSNIVKDRGTGRYSVSMALTSFEYVA